MENERNRTYITYNLGYVDLCRVEGRYQMPLLAPTAHIPPRLIGFNYARTHTDREAGVHFYLDDYQFERVWKESERYIGILSRFDCVLTPDFSLYMDMPMPMKIWNTFRSRLIGQIMQDAGITVIPTVSWAEKASFAFCFEGLPERSVLSISTVGVKKDAKAFAYWKAGTTELIRCKKPTALLVYGGRVDYDYGDTSVIYFENAVTEKMQNGR